jgi:hypothetical protein
VTRAPRFPCVAAALLIAATSAIAWFPRLVGVAAPHALAWFFAFGGVAALAFARIARFAWRDDADPAAAAPATPNAANHRGPSPITLVAFALLLRAPALCAEPWLSDDLWRYLWEGKVARAGFSPYEFAPDAPELAPLRDEVHARVAHREVSTVYPPLAQLLFRGLPESERRWKVVVLAADVALLLLLRRALASRGLPARRLLLYAAHPLVALEGANSGHVDLIAWLPMVAGLVALEGRDVASRARRLVAGVATGLAALIKPQALAPAVAFVRRRDGVALLGVVATIALGFAPFAKEGANLFTGTARYAHDWEFNGLAYPPAVRVAEIVKEELGKLPNQPLELWRVRELAYPIVPNQLGRKLATLLFLGVAFLLARRLAAQPVALAFAILVAFLATAPVVYPWYVAWLVPFTPLLPARATRAALLLTFTSLAAYAVRIETLAHGGWFEPQWLGAVTWLPPCLLGAYDLWSVPAPSSAGSSAASRSYSAGTL